MASRRTRVRELLANLDKVHGGARRVRRIDEPKTLGWARLASARLRRLIDRIDKEESGPRRDDALQELDALRRSTFWPGDDRDAERYRVTLREAAEAKRTFSDALPSVREAKKFFRGFAGAAPPSRDDIADYLATQPRLRALAAELGFTWTVALVEQLNAAAPAAWLIERIAEASDQSTSTVKNLVHRRARRSK